MVHNGVLQGVKSDKKQMSDTWHFIRDTLKPLLAANVDLLRSPAFIALLKDRIGGSNKLVFLDNLGRTTVVNEAAYHDFSGARLSNTYAWSSHSKHNTEFPEDLIKSYVRSSRGYQPYQSSKWWDQDAEGEDLFTAERAVFPSTSLYDDLENTVYEYPEAVASMLNDYGITAADVRGYFSDEATACCRYRI